MAQFWARVKDDGNGPYRWCPVVNTPEGLALGSIYRQRPDDLTSSQIEELTAHIGIELSSVADGCRP